MHRFSFLIFFVFCCLSFSFASDSLPKEEDINLCGDAPRPMRVIARHLEPKGIGYHEGYSTIDAFLTPYEFLNQRLIPFLDLRAHIFNNGKPAMNAGLGVRYIASRVWGVNAYYDYRNTKRQNYNQVATGLESLGREWDFRLNGYLPVGKKRSFIFDVEFDGFHHHHLMLSFKREVAMKGLNAETGYHVNACKKYPIYFAFGPYYLNGGGAAWGGNLRGTIDFHEYVKLEGGTSYDHIFKWIGQAQVSITIPFGKRKEVHRNPQFSCPKWMALQLRARQRVDRNEIIAIHTEKVKKLAVDPTTGRPYLFLFVNNTSHSAGTYESPFNTLSAAETYSGRGDVIYVFPGDGTSKGMNAGIQLKEKQRLLSSSLPHTFETTHGTIFVPALSGTAPVLNNGEGVRVTVTLANQSEISGFMIQDDSKKGNITASSNCIITHNTLIVPATGISGAFSGRCAVANNQILAMGGSSAEIDVAVDLNVASGTVSFTNNRISSFDGAVFKKGIRREKGAADLVHLDIAIEGNKFNRCKDTISLVNSATSSIEAGVRNNIILQHQPGNYGIELQQFNMSPNSFRVRLMNNFVGQVDSASDFAYVLMTSNNSTIDLLEAGNNIGSLTTLNR